MPSDSTPTRGTKRKVMHELEQKESRRQDKMVIRRFERAERREKLYGKCPGLITRGTKSFLEKKVVSTPREKSYEKAWVDFKGWARTESLPIRSVEELDLALTNKINVMFFEGLDPTDAVTLVAAAKYYREDITKATIMTKTRKR